MKESPLANGCWKPLVRGRTTALIGWRIDLRKTGEAHGYCSPAGGTERGTHFVKWLPRGASDRALEHFARQVAISMTVEHRGILPAVDYQLEGGPATLVLPRIELMTLSDWLAARPQVLDRSTALRIAIELLSAVSALHTSGYVHRNLHSGHVAIDGDGAVVLVGLGGCEPVGDGVDERAFVAIKAAQSAGRLAPERIRSRRRYASADQPWEYSLAEDTYALAWILAELFGRTFLTSSLGRAMLSANAETRPRVSELLELLLALQSGISDRVRVA